MKKRPQLPAFHLPNRPLCQDAKQRRPGASHTAIAARCNYTICGTGLDLQPTFKFFAYAGTSGRFAEQS